MFCLYCFGKFIQTLNALPTFHDLGPDPVTDHIDAAKDGITQWIPLGKTEALAPLVVEWEDNPPHPSPAERAELLEELRS